MGRSRTAPRPLPATERPARSDTEVRILGAALDLFAERGFAATTTAEIARRAGVAEKTLFARFKTKDDLFEQTLTPATVELLVPALRAPLAAVGGGWSRLEDFLVMLMSNRMQVFRAHPAKFKMIMQELLLRPERARQFIAAVDREITPAVEGTLRSLRRKGELRDVPFTLVHRTCLSVLFGYAIYRLVLRPTREGQKGQLWDDESEIRAMVGLLVDGLRPRRTGSAAPAPQRKSRRRRSPGPSGGGAQPTAVRAAASTG